MPFGQDHYIPLLRAKQGELEALGQAAGPVRAQMTPLVDITEEPDDIDHELNRLVLRLDGGWGTTDRIIIDLNSLGNATSASGQHAVAFFHDAARAAGLITVPTVTGGASAAFVAEVAAVAAADRAGACIRITSDDLQDFGAVAPLIDDTLHDLSLAAADVDLVVDVGAIDHRTLSLQTAVLNAVLPTLPHQPDWRSYTLASGAFPASLQISRYVPTPLPRTDMELWLRIAGNTLPRTPGFGDYAVTGPAATTGGQWAGAANLRYTVDDHWLAIKGRGRSPIGNREFQEICAQVAASNPNPLAAASYSWGDDNIQRCAARNGGPGGGTQWRAWATSHHLARVTDRLANLGAP